MIHLGIHLIVVKASRWLLILYIIIKPVYICMWTGDKWNVGEKCKWSFLWDTHKNWTVEWLGGSAPTCPWNKWKRLHKWMYRGMQRQIYIILIDPLPVPTSYITSWLQQRNTLITVLHKKWCANILKGRINRVLLPRYPTNEITQLLHKQPAPPRNKIRLGHLFS
jgi:hypothetical protein